MRRDHKGRFRIGNTNYIHGIIVIVSAQCLYGPYTHSMGD